LQYKLISKMLKNNILSMQIFDNFDNDSWIVPDVIDEYKRTHI